MKILPIVIFVATDTVQALASSANVYIAQSVGGSGNGSSCANALAYGFFNTASNWGSGASQIGPGTTVHICGTIAGSTGTNGLTTQGDGASGSPVTILFESGASMQAPSWGTFSTNPTGGAITVLNQYITVDLGTNGNIEDTLNGTSGNTGCPGGTCTLKNVSAGIYIGASYVTIQGEGGNIGPMFTRTACSSAAGDASTYDVFIDGGAGALSNITVNGITGHDAQGGITATVGGSGISNLTFENNTLYHGSAGIVVAAGGGAGTASNTTVSNNNIYDNYVYWDPIDDTHLNGIFIFAAASGTHLTNVTVNGNYIHGDFGGATCGGSGSHTTAFIYLETTGGGAASGEVVYNNVLVSGNNDDPADGMLSIGDENTTGTQVYNNTFVGANDGSGYCAILTGTFTWKNNLCDGLTYAVYANGSGRSQITAADYNLYYNNSTGWRLGSTIYSTFSAWQALGHDTHGLDSMPNISASYAPQSTSPAIGAASNLISLGITALLSDRAGLPRPTSGAWTSGAYNYPGSTSLPASPSGLTATVQ